ncbi:MAG TPA: YhjD/YihY/BrkB family envelope integrity protein [Acidimicrobiales bacterium]|nr:YhjD/YihY/BrkB family envelope integrity protein [Acidimicrobiales bacterium]
MKEKLRALGRRYPWLGWVLRVQERYSELNGNHLASAITLAGFISLFPLLLVAIAVLGFFSHQSLDLASDVVDRLGLTGEAATIVTEAIERAEHSRKAASVIGVGGLLWSGLGLVAAIQYGLNTVWQVKGQGLRDKLSGLGWLAGAAVLFLASFGATAAIGFVPVLAPLGIVVGVGVGVALWLWTLKVLPNRDVGWKALLPGAVVGAVGMELLKVVGSIWVPKAVASSSALYGSLGVVFAVLAWLLFFGRLVVYAAVVNVVVWEDRHGTVTVDMEVPRVPGEVPVEATRAGDALRPASASTSG